MIYVLIGPPGVGKSSVIREIVDNIQPKHVTALDLEQYGGDEAERREFIKSYFSSNDLQDDIVVGAADQIETLRKIKQKTFMILLKPRKYASQLNLRGASQPGKLNQIKQNLENWADYADYVLDYDTQDVSHVANMVLSIVSLFSYEKSSGTLNSVTEFSNQYVSYRTPDVDKTTIVITLTEAMASTIRRHLSVRPGLLDLNSTSGRAYDHPAWSCRVYSLSSLDEKTANDAPTLSNVIVVNELETWSFDDYRCLDIQARLLGVDNFRNFRNLMADNRLITPYQVRRAINRISSLKPTAICFTQKVDFLIDNLVQSFLATQND